MNSEAPFSHIPHELQSMPWIQQLIAVLQEQTRQIQAQAEEITALKKTVQEQKDEINRLKKMPKRPTFGSGGGNPKDRSGKPDNGKEKGAGSIVTCPQKMIQK